MKAEHDPLASHIFVSRRYYRNVNDTKSGKRREMIARLSFNTACELGFRGSLNEWERLMGAVARKVNACPIGPLSKLNCVTTVALTPLALWFSRVGAPVARE